MTRKRFRLTGVYNYRVEPQSVPTSAEKRSLQPKGPHLTTAAGSPRSAVVAARLHPEVAVHLRQLAKRDGVTVSTYIDRALETVMANATTDR